jgi:hypothetical protein
MHEHHGSQGSTGRELELQTERELELQNRKTHNVSVTMPQADGMILAKEEESDAEVRREDQDRINEFGGLNARLYEVRAEVKKLKVSNIIAKCIREI